MNNAETRPATRRQALRQRPQRKTRITVPTGVSPHVRLVFEEMGRQRMTYDFAEEKSGILRTTIKAWRHKNVPGLVSIEAVLGALGWDFVPIPRARVLPSSLVAELEPIAERHGLSTSQTIQALIALVARVHERFPDNAASLPSGGIGGTDTSLAA